MSAFKHLQGRRPVDALARRVTGKGEHSPGSLGPGESETPLALWVFSGLRKDDLTGTKWGLLTVIGFAAVETRYREGAAPKKPNVRGSLWVVRCVCGVYSRRRTRSLKKSTSLHACHQCNNKHAALDKRK